MFHRGTGKDIRHRREKERLPWADVDISSIGRPGFLWVSDVLIWWVDGFRISTRSPNWRIPLSENRTYRWGCWLFHLPIFDIPK